MRRTFILGAALALAMSAVSFGAEAAPCRDSHGKFTKCPAPAAKHCRDIKTKKFAKCGAPHTMPAG